MEPKATLGGRAGGRAPAFLVYYSRLCNAANNTIETLFFFVVQVRTQRFAIYFIVFIIYLVVQIHAAGMGVSPVCQQYYIFSGNLFDTLYQQLPFFFPSIFIFYVKNFSL